MALVLIVRAGSRSARIRGRSPVRCTRLGGPLAAAIILAGCVLSVDPVVSEAEAIFDPRLVGIWEEVSGSDRAVVSRAAGTTYAIEYTSDGRTGMFEARLGRLGQHLVLDVWPAGRDSDQLQPDAGLLIAGHVLLALDIGADEIRAATLEPDSLLAALRAGQVGLAHGGSGDQLVLYGRSEELAPALASYLDRPGALAAPGEWRRARGEGATAPVRPVEVPCFEASPWREADQLFRRDRYWLGADVASSVDLGDGRTLWLFGDTWIDPSGAGTRQGAHMISNSVAIQIGEDPSTASISFYWGETADGSPDALFPDQGERSLWFGNGVLVRDRLVLFFAPTLRGTGMGLGFENLGWGAVLVENPGAEPPAWRVRPLDTPPNPLGVPLGYAAVGQLGEHVYAFGSLDPVKSHPVYAARWPVGAVHDGDLRNPEWWAGARVGWVSDSAGAPRWPLFENGGSELSIHFDQTTRRFLQVQTTGFGPADLVMRAAPALTGPWSRPRMLYRPPEYYRQNVMIYAGKAHPHLGGADLVLTYATNSLQFTDLMDSRLYHPRFVRLARCE